MPTDVASLFSKGTKMLVEDPVEALRRVGRLILPMRAEYRRRFQMTLARWLLYHQSRIVFEKCHWMGVRSYKNPMDAWIYQEIIWEVKPEVIVEIGSAHGGTTLYFAHLLDLIGHGSVISVDIDRRLFSAHHPRIVQVTGDSGSSEVVARVTGLSEGRRTLVVHDGDHQSEPVLRDLRAYSKLVGVGSYFIVEDGVMDLFRPGDGLGTFARGPLAAIEAFLAENSDFTIDRSRERYILTYNPMGFLKRSR